MVPVHGFIPLSRFVPLLPVTNIWNIICVVRCHLEKREADPVTRVFIVVSAFAQPAFEMVSGENKRRKTGLAEHCHLLADGML